MDDNILDLGKILIVINDNPEDGITRNRYYFTFDIERLREMFDHEDHEISKTCEYDHVQEALYIYDTMF